MKYPKLANIDSTPEQDLGLTIAYKKALNASFVASDGLPPISAELYLADLVLRKLQDFEAENVRVDTAPELKAKIDVAVQGGTKPQTDAYIAFVEQNYAIDLTPVIPAIKP